MPSTYSLARRADYTPTLGALELGMFFNAILWSQECSLMWTLFWRNKNKERHDALWIRILLVILWVNDSFATATEIYQVYLYTITNWGNETYLLKQYWPMVVFCVSAGISAAICQSFLIVRVYKLTKQWIYVVVLGLTACVAFGGTIFAGVETGLNADYSNRAADDAGVTTWLVGNACCDFLIALALIVFLVKARRVASRFEASQLQGPLTKMIFLAAETGALTTVWACVALAVYKQDNTTNASVGMGYCLGRLYALTMLFCLFQRKSITANNPTSAELHTNKASRFGGAGHGGQSRIPVTVRHDQTVVVDDGATAVELSPFGQRSQTGEHPFSGGIKVNPRHYMIGDDDLEDEKAGHQAGRYDAV